MVFYKEKREELISKFQRNLELIVDFVLSYECYCDISDTWEEKAFNDSEVTHRQYYETIKKISDLEYSEEQCEAIKTSFIHKNAVEDYIKSLDSQYVNLKPLCEEIKAKEDKLLDLL